MPLKKKSTRTEQGKKLTARGRCQRRLRMPSATFQPNRIVLFSVSGGNTGEKIEKPLQPLVEYHAGA
jgi:hypothetical protein